MAITFPYSGSAHNSATLSFTTSSDVLSTDAIWCMIGINLTGNTITPPSGFTELTLSGGNNTAGNLAQVRLYYNLAPAASTTYNATHGGSGRSDLAWVQVRGSNNTSIANHVNTSVGGAKAASDTPVSSSITTTNAITTLLGFVGFRAFPVNSVAPGGGFTEIIDSVGADGSTNIRLEFASLDVTSTGSYTYGVSLTVADGEPTIIGLVAINPGGAADQNVTASGIASAERLGSANVSPAVGATGIASGEQFGAAQVSATYTINASGIVSSERTGTPTFSTTYTINANGIASSERLGSTAVGQNVTASGIPTTAQLGSPNIHLSITAAGIRSNEQLGGPTVTPGSVTINASGIASAEASGGASVILAQSISANGITSREAVGAPTISVGAVTINANGIGSCERIGSAQLGVSVTPAGIPSSEGIGSPTITVAAAGISAGNIASCERLGSPTITSSVTITTHGIRSEERAGNNTLYREILSGGIKSTERLGSPTFTMGPATINAGGIPSGTALGSPIINAIPLVPPTPNTLIKLRIGQTVLVNDTGQSIVRMGDSETLISI